MSMIVPLSQAHMESIRLCMFISHFLLPALRYAGKRASRGDIDQLGRVADGDSDGEGGDGDDSDDQGLSFHFSCTYNI